MYTISPPAAASSPRARLPAPCARPGMRLLLLLALVGAAWQQAAALTFANQTAVLLAFKEEMLKRGPNWAVALEVSQIGSARLPAAEGEKHGGAGGVPPAMLGHAAAAAPSFRRGPVFCTAQPERAPSLRAELEVPHRPQDFK